MCVTKDKTMLRLADLVSVTFTLLSAVSGSDVTRYRSPEGTTNGTWYISRGSLIREHCGSFSAPCPTFNDVTTVGHEDVTIKVFYSPENKNSNCSRMSFKINNSLTISNVKDYFSHIGCGYNAGGAKTTLRFTFTKNISRLTLQNLHFENVNIILDGGHVIVKNCLFWHSMINSTTVRNKRANIKMENTKWYGKAVCENDTCIPSGQVIISGRYHYVTLKDNTFSHTKLEIAMTSNCDIEYVQNKLTNDKGEKSVKGGLFVVFSLTAVNSTLSLRRSLFENQYSVNPVELAMNLFESALRVRFLIPRGENPSYPNSIQVYIDDCTFQNNERALTFQGPIERIHIRNSRFLSNVAMHAGAGILLLTDKQAVVDNCTFSDNAAGRIRQDHFTPKGTYFKLQHDEAQVHSGCCKGSVSLVGKGGAIRIQKGSVIIQNSYFANNTARILGGSLFVDRGSATTLTNTTFLNTPTIALAAQQGDVIFSSGNVEIDVVKFQAVSAANHISLLQHSGDHWSISIYNVSVECPIGYRLRVMNTSAYKVVEFTGLMRSYRLDQLSYFCEACPRYKYSLEMGYFHYSIGREQPGYFTLMINGENPLSAFEGTYIYKDIKCLRCPYGGNCDHDQLRGLPNFWGYIYNDTDVKFQLCPKGYCCSSKLCPTFNACAKKRTGKLCSECIKGHTEALFSSKCVPNDTCGPYWIWGFLFGMGFLYALLLFFQKDIRDFIFSKSNLSCKDTEQKEETMTDEEKEKCLQPLTPNVISVSGQDSVGQVTVLIKANDAVVGSEMWCNKPTSSSANDILANDNVSAMAGKQDLGEAHDSADAAQDPAAPDSPPPPATTDFGAIMLITILYYFQDAQLLHVKTAFAAPEPPEWALIKAILLGLFKFRLEIAHFVDNVCLIVGLGASMKLMVRTIMVPYVLALFGLLYMLHWLLCGRRGNDPEKTFQSRLAMGFMLALLFTYQMLATASFSLLSCVPVGDNNVLFIDATVTCYSSWQYAVLTYAMSCIIPFSFVLMLGPGLLQEGRISVGTFFAACLVPLPFVVAWLIVRAFKKDKWLSQRKGFPTPPGEVVIKVLQGPFNDIKTRLTGPLCWAGVLVFRRLVLVLLYTFINIALFRILSMLFVCFVILMNQVHVKPYQDPRANLAGSASVAALMFVGGINLVRASFEAAEYTPHGPYELLITVMQETENLLMLWIPLCFMIIVGLIVIVKITVSVIRCSGLKTKAE